MTEEKAKRIVSASVATAVILLVTLLCVLVFQMVCLTNRNEELAELKRAEQEYEQLKIQTQDEIALWLEEWKIEEAARKYGYRNNK